MLAAVRSPVAITKLDEAKAHAEAQALIAKGLAAPKEEPAPELVSRRVQAGIGLVTGVMIYNVAFGGLFALAFGLAYGRMGDFDPRTTAALLAALGFVAVYVVPNLKYPANPPAVGEPATIGMRTALYFSMIAISLAAMIAAGMLRLRLLAGSVASMSNPPSSKRASGSRRGWWWSAT